MGVEDYRLVIVEDSGLAKKNPYDIRGNTIYLHGDIYRNLGSIIKSSQIVEHKNPNNIYQNFIRDMNSLYNPSQEYQPSNQDKVKLRVVDEYLGTFGIGIEYPKDRYPRNLKSSVTAEGEYISPFN